LQRTLQRTLLLLDTMIDFQTAASNGGRFLLRLRLFRYLNGSWNCAPTTTPRCAGEMLSAFPRKDGRPAGPPISNAPLGALRSWASTAIATAPAARATNKTADDRRRANPAPVRSPPAASSMAP